MSEGSACLKLPFVRSEADRTSDRTNDVQGGEQYTLYFKSPSKPEGLSFEASLLLPNMILVVGHSRSIDALSVDVPEHCSQPSRLGSTSLEKIEVV